ncbi:phosphotransferase [bacterium]|nr:phosphotransferase [bacterium]
MQSTVKEVAARFGINATVVAPAGSTGLSGASVWKITGDQGRHFSVKRFTNLSADHLAWIHRVQLHTIVCDCDFVARPLRTDDGMSLIQANDGLWEVCTWMLGEANNESPISDQRLSLAMKSIAKFHQSAAQVNFDFRPSPGVKVRLEQLAKLNTTIAAVQPKPNQYPTLANLLTQLKQISPARLHDYATALGHFENYTLPLQPVIRDLRSEHLLFTEDSLTGLIDFDAMQMETIALDLTRCLGDFDPGDTDRWQFALEAYNSVRPIQRAELELIKILDPINVMLSAMNWIKWIALDDRNFENEGAVEVRLKQINQRLAKIL